MSQRILEVLRRINAPNWNLSNNPQGIRILTDEQGRMLTLLTVPINPQDTQPISPGSLGSVKILDNAGTGISTSNPLAVMDPRYGFGKYETFTTPTIVNLGGYVTGAAANRWTTLRAHTAGAGYQVTAGTSLYIYKVAYRGTVVGPGPDFGYGDTDVGISGVAAPTTPIYFGGAQAADSGPHYVTVINTRYVLDVWYRVPAGKYPFIQWGTNTSYLFVELWGFEA